MPWKLFSYILVDVLKLAVISTLSLTLVFSFATAIKPLYDGNLGALTLIRFIAYSMPTMLTLVLPFSAGFAVTIVYCRLVMDNEVTACLASGMSYRALILPVAVFGLVLTGLTFYLSNWVLPDFYGRVAGIVERDVSSILLKQINDGKPVRLPDDVWFFADEGAMVDDLAPMPGQSRTPFRRMMLRGVVLGQYGTEQQREATAEAADLYFYRDEGRTYVEVVYEGAMAYDLARGQVRLPGTVKYSRVYLPNLLRDNPRYHSWPRLNRLAREPDRFDRVRTAKQKLVRTVASNSLLTHLSKTLTASGSARAFLRSSSGHEVYQITSPGVQRQGDTLLLAADAAEPVQMVVTIDGQVHSRIDAPAARVDIMRPDRGGSVFGIESPGRSEEPFAVVRFEKPQVTDLQRSAPVVRRTEMERIGRWSQDVASPLASLNAQSLLGMARRDPHLAASASCGAAADVLEREMTRLKRKIISQINQRGATAMSVVLFLVAGALLGLKLGRLMPLIVYMWFFLLVTVVLVITYSGASIIEDAKQPLTFGIAMSWMGGLVVALFDLVFYFILARR